MSLACLNFQKHEGSKSSYFSALHYIMNRHLLYVCSLLIITLAKISEKSAFFMQDNSHSPLLRIAQCKHFVMSKLTEDSKFIIFTAQNNVFYNI